MATRKARRPKRAAAPARARGKKTTTARKAGSASKTTVERRRTAPATLRLRTIEPGFTVNDLDRSLRFYTDVLGFIVDQKWTSETGILQGVSLKAGVCQLNLTQDDWAKGRNREKGVAVRLYCHTAQDIDAIAERIRAGGGRLTEEPKDQPWGARTLSVDDPDGFHITMMNQTAK
jgi:catechol 2,3-dioxygenase-like lactoylglutathione lyase family enzyme